MSAWSGLREEREVGRRLARRIAGLFELGLERRVVRDERFQRRAVRRGLCEVKFWRAGFALTPTLSQRERGLGGAGWRVWSKPDRSMSCAP
ncbi:ABC transporter substrate-binding protein [Pseudomonas sp. BGr12]|uniref:ABC transporter substrate-binding protein n=1 Tax=unclassified Pseudomonas TaxID=196821 RepID=UPI0017866497|nr:MULTISPECIES: ABC transporter substrate-binding protein [unclassified Pseudomonas]MBD9502049.1 ABC transporter substrate-binding protein [Pseudomonas sp. PDM17]MDL2429254.1 ABC transporter substrate-binding protein [Pseudomonas sp. BJa5]